ALEMADWAAQRGSDFIVNWEHLIRGIMRFRVGDEDGAKADFEEAVAGCEKSIANFENFDPLDTLAFSHAGLALLGRQEHIERAVTGYRRARKLAPAPGIVDIGRKVFFCLGRTPRSRESLSVSSPDASGPYVCTSCAAH